MASLKRCCGKYLKIRFILMVTIILLILNLIKYLQNSHHAINNGYNWRGQTLPLNYLMDKIDWHDHKQIEIDKKRTGPGEQGAPAAVYIDPAEKTKVYSVNGFNGALSDKIALDRALPDIRHEGCLNKKYLKSLPTVGVVVPFHNEHWTTLLRTVYSVMNRSPPHLLKEIVIVDDASTKEFLKQQLDDYISAHLPKVTVVRIPSRRGLITARLLGAERITADVIIFLDSHTEANVNWLPPLLEPIAVDYTTVVCPFVDVIDYEDFAYRAQDEGARGAFDWEFYYKRLPLLPKDLDNMPEPFESPVMAGGLFAIARKFFLELGGYDPELDIWGGEQYELSFKIWQCGGRMYDAPCSRVGHIYRKFAAFPNPNHGDFVARNHRRVAEVWMDEYAKYVYNRRPNFLKVDPGDLSKQFALRKQLNCKPFKWFMTQVAFDIVGKYPPVEKGPLAEGRIRPALDTELCMDSRQNKEMGNLTLARCQPLTSNDYYQGFLFTWRFDIMSATSKFCWDLPHSAPKRPVVLYKCHLGGGNQEWKYDIAKSRIVHSVGDKCLDWDPKTKVPYINWCSDAPTQQWMFDRVYVDTWPARPPAVTGPVLDDGY